MRNHRMLAVLAGVAAAAGLGTMPAGAHHSTAAFDTARVIKIDGVSEGDTPDGLWTVEMTAPNVLINQGWTRTALKVGDKVTMYVNPLRNAIELNDGSQGGLYVGVVLADGNKLGQTDGKGAGSSN